MRLLKYLKVQNRIRNMDTHWAGHDSKVSSVLPQFS